MGLYVMEEVNQHEIAMSEGDAMPPTVHDHEKWDDGAMLLKTIDPDPDRNIESYPDGVIGFTGQFLDDEE